MKNTRVKKVMLSTLLAVGLLFGVVPSSAMVEVKAPIVENLGEEETLIKLPSSDYTFSTMESTVDMVEEFKMEAQKVQHEREEQIRKAIEAEQRRLAELEAKRKAELEAKKRAEREAEEKRKAEAKAKEVEVKQKVQKEQTDKGTSFEASYYTPYCNGCSGKTATGENVRDSIYVNGMRVIAVDPRIIPLHSIVMVTTPHETFKAIALDTGGAIKGRKVDILVKDTSTAYKLGRHSVHIKVLKEEK